MPRYQQDLADCLAVLGAARQQLKQYPEALALYKQAQTLARELTSRYPDSLEYRHAVLKYCCSLASCQRENGKPDEARQSYEQAAALLNKLVADYPRNTVHRDWLNQVNEELKRLSGP